MNCMLYNCMLYNCMFHKLVYTISSVKMCSVDNNNGLSLNSVESLNSAKKHYSVSMLIKGSKSACH